MTYKYLINTTNLLYIFKNCNTVQQQRLKLLKMPFIFVTLTLYFYKYESRFSERYYTSQNIYKDCMLHVLHNFGAEFSKIELKFNGRIAAGCRIEIDIEVLQATRAAGVLVIQP